LDYTIHKQTFLELELKYHKSEKTIRKYFDLLPKQVQGALPPLTLITDTSRVVIKPLQTKVTRHHYTSSTTRPIIKSRVNIIMDTTYFGRTLGVMVFRGNLGVSKVYSNLYWKYLKHETLKEYHLGLYTLSSRYYFKSFTVDNKGGLIKMLQRKYPDTPIQLCQFHMVAQILRYTTRNPQSECGKAIKQLILTLTKTNQTIFTTNLKHLIQHHSSFIQERNHVGNYTHSDIRSAITSIHTNLPHLFTYQRYPHLTIPNTSNSAEGSFGQWKYKIKLHRHQRLDRRKKMIDMILSNHNQNTETKN
jgi:hypothetical protein